MAGRRGTEVTGPDDIALIDPAGRTRAQPQRQPRRPPWPRAVLAGLKRQADRCETTGDIETGAALDADRLQRDRVAGATHQHIGADPDPNRSACGCATVAAGQRSWR